MLPAETMAPGTVHYRLTTTDRHTGEESTQFRHVPGFWPKSASEPMVLCQIPIMADVIVARDGASVVEKQWRTGPGYVPLSIAYPGAVAVGGR